MRNRTNDISKIVIILTVFIAGLILYIKSDISSHTLKMILDILDFFL